MEGSKPKIKLRSSTKVWLACLPILALLQIFNRSLVWETLLVGMGVTCMVAYLWARELASHLRLLREIRFGWARVGDILEERFTLSNTGIVPAVWVEISDQSTLANYQIGQVTAISGNAKNTWRSKTICSQRGIFSLGPTIIKTSDPLGLFQVIVELPETTSLMVLPPVVPLPTIEIAPGGRIGEGRRSQPDPFERTVSSAGARPYYPGDPLRWLHWRLSAHHDELFVRTFDSTPSSDWWILLDLEQQTQIGEGADSSIEHGVILAASLAEQGLRTGVDVGLAVAGEPLVWLPPDQTAAHRLDILRSLALVNPGNTSLDQLLRATRPKLHRGASLIVITASQSSSWIEFLANQIHSLVVPTVLIFDPHSYQGYGEIGPVENTLASIGIKPFVITRQLLDRSEARPGESGQWEWRVTGFGRAIPMRKPSDLSWRKIGA